MPRFVGRVGGFTPVLDGAGGGRLLRIDKSGEKYHSATGAKGRLWVESTSILPLGLSDEIDLDFYNCLVKEAMDSIGQYCDAESFIEPRSNSIKE